MMKPNEKKKVQIFAPTGGSLRDVKNGWIFNELMEMCEWHDIDIYIVWQELYETAMRFIRANTGIQGLGIQAHVKDFTKPDPTMMWVRWKKRERKKNKQ